MDCTTYKETITVLQTTYQKPKNEIFACDLLAIQQQQWQISETISKRTLNTNQRLTSGR